MKDEKTEVDDQSKYVEERVTDHDPKASSSGLSRKCQKFITFTKFITLN